MLSTKNIIVLRILKRKGFVEETHGEEFKIINGEKDDHVINFNHNCIDNIIK